jgi:hypothetical protein
MSLTYTFATDNQVTGSTTTFAYASGVVTVTIPTTAAVIPGDAIVIAGATSSGNNGIFNIETVPTSTTLTILNASGVSESGVGTFIITKHVGPFTLTLTVDNTTGSSNVQILNVVPLASDRNFAFSNVDVQGCSAGAGVSQITTGFTNSVLTVGRADGNLTYLPNANVGVSAPVEVATGSVAYITCYGRRMSKVEKNTVVSALEVGDSAAVLHATRIPTAVSVSLVPTILTESTGAISEVAQTAISMAF